MAAERELLDPDYIAGRTFPMQFRGYDPGEVHDLLRSIADGLRSSPRGSNGSDQQLADLAAERDALRDRIAQLERSSSTAENDDAFRVTELITSETTQVIETARASATEIIRKAETEASRRRREVKELEQRVDAEIKDKRAAVSEDTARIRRETQAEVTKMRAEAEEETKSQRSKADEYAGATRAQAQEILRSRTAEAETYYETRTRKTEEATSAMRAEAEEEAETMRRNAEDAAAHMRREAEEETTELRRRTEDEAKKLREDVESEANEMLTQARSEVGELKSEAERIRAESSEVASKARTEAAAAADLATKEVRDEARMMVAEARAVREKILQDLVRRRRLARQQIDQARAARDRLIRSIEEVRRQLDEATGELELAVPEARAAMDRVGVVTPSDDDLEVAAVISTLERARPEREGRFQDLGSEPETDAYSRRLAGEDPEEPLEEAPGGEEVAPSGDASADNKSEASADAASSDVAEIEDPEADLLVDIEDVEGVEELEKLEPVEDATAPIFFDQAHGAGEAETRVSPQEFMAQAEETVEETVAPDGPEPVAEDPVADLASEDQDQNVTSGGAFGDFPAESEVALDEAVLDDDNTDLAQAIPAALRSSAPPIEDGLAETVVEPGDANVEDEAPPVEDTPPAPEERVRSGLFGLGADADRSRDDDDTPALFKSTTPDGGSASQAPSGTAPAPEILDVEVAPQFVARDILLEEQSTELRRQLKRALADDQSDLLDALRRGGPDASIEDLPVPERQVARFADALEGPLRASSSAGAEAVHGSAWPGVVDGLVAKVSRDLVDDVRGVVAGIVGDGGGAKDSSLEAIRAHYRAVRTEQLSDLADNALRQAFALGAYHGTPDAQSVVWLGDPRHAENGPCAQNAGASVEKPAEFPSGDAHPPAQAQCRCLVLPNS